MNERNSVKGVSFAWVSALLRWKLAIIVSLACMVCTEGAVVSAQWIENPANGHWYRLTSGPMNIEQARLEASNSGGTLVAINDAAENEFIVDYFTTPGTASTYLWIGLSDLSDEGTYLWDNGDPFIYQSWMGGEPNNLNNEDYAEMNTNPSGVPTANYGRWNDTDGFINLKYGLIERDTAPPAPAQWIGVDPICSPGTSTTGDHVGASVSVHGDTVVVGMPGGDPGVSVDAGSVLILERDPVTGQLSLVQQINSPSPGDGDEFGITVSIDGNVLAVGAWLDDTSTGVDAGSVYLYERDPISRQWSFVQQFSSPGVNTNFDHFGNKVSVSGDHLAVGQIGGDPGPFVDSGSVYLYRRDASTGQWNLVQQLSQPVQANGDEFGNALAITGNILAVGAWLDDIATGIDAGSVFLFELEPSTGQWNFIQQISSPGMNTVEDHFAFSVSISGDQLAIGQPGGDPGALVDSGSVFLYTRDPSTGQWNFGQQLTQPSPANGDEFGNDVAISGNVLAVGACLDDNGTIVDAGSVYFYQRDPATGQWQLGQAIQNPSSQGGGAQFGNAVSAAGDLVAAGSWLADISTGTDAGCVTLFEGSMQPPSPFAIIATPEIAILDDDPVASIASVLISIDEATSPSPEISGISISLGHDSSVLENPTVEMSATLADLNNGTGPGFLAVNPCSEGITIGVVTDIVDPCALVLPVSGGLDVATIDYDVTASAAAAGVPLETTVDFVDGLCTVQGSVNNTVSDCTGNSYPIAAANRFGATLVFVAEEQFMRPDCNVDGVYDIADAISVLGYLFTGTAVPSCLAACDANADGTVNVADAITNLNGLFVPGSPPIAEPFGACGFEPFTPSAGCVSYGSCP